MTDEAETCDAAHCELCNRSIPMDADGFVEHRHPDGAVCLNSSRDPRPKSPKIPQRNIDQHQQGFISGLRRPRTGFKLLAVIGLVLVLFAVTRGDPDRDRVLAADRAAQAVAIEAAQKSNSATIFASAEQCARSAYSAAEARFTAGVPADSVGDWRYEAQQCVEMPGITCQSERGGVWCGPGYWEHPTGELRSARFVKLEPDQWIDIQRALDAPTKR